MQPALPHGPLRQVFPDVFVVTGTSAVNFGGLDWRYSRNMTVLRSGRELCLINTVRLSERGLAELAELGSIEHVVRLGAFHGMDDEFYLRGRTAGVRLWALPGMVHGHSFPTTDILEDSQSGPVPGSQVFCFSTAQYPEGAILLEREGGILITCDSLQNWTEPDEYFDDASIERMKAGGFFFSGNPGPGFMAASRPAAADFGRLLQLPFQHLLSAHGTPLLHGAQDVISSRLMALGIQ